MPTAMSLMWGKQEDDLRQRLKEHKKETEKVEKSKRNLTRQTRKQSESEQSKSAIADHMVQHNHIINWQDAKIPCKGVRLRCAPY